MGKTVRCPYCVLGHEFRPMVAHVDGRYICNRCGHITCLGDAKYDCHCPQCLKLIFRTFGCRLTRSSRLRNTAE
jgi:hypothetical protein